MDPKLRDYFRELGRRGGQAKTQAKKKAATKNAKIATAIRLKRQP